MSDTLPTPHRLRHTPLRDLLRGRVTGRLDWRRRLARSPLPGEVKDVIGRTTDRTRLWQLEKAAVAGELIAHFTDGLAAGTDAETLIRDFGDERTAAKLVRRAKRRGRPLAWHAARYATHGLLVLTLLYGVAMARFLLGRPTITVDYVARLNEPTARTPESDRAWPLYRQAILSLGFERIDKNNLPTPYRPIDRYTRRTVIEATPAEAAWTELTGWLDAHAAGLALLRQAAAKPALGFVIGPGGSAYDPPLGWNFASLPPQGPMDGVLFSVLLPHLNRSRQLANLLMADARYAAAQGNGARAAADVNAGFGIAAQQKSAFLVSGLVGIGMDHLAFDQLEQMLADTPGLFDDRQLADLAGRVAKIGGDAAAAFFDLEGERMVFRDVIQRTYTDDGHGDGRLTAEGAQMLTAQLRSPFGRDERLGKWADYTLTLAAVGAAAPFGSRRDVMAEYDRLFDVVVARMSRPLRDRPDGGKADAAVEQRVEALRASRLLSTRYLPVVALMSTLNQVDWAAERVIGRRDGLAVGLALERYRRQSGQYPTTLDALVPALLPRVPADRITGDPVRYQLIDGKPVVYSVGVDRVDDTGRVPPPRGVDDAVNRAAAAEWPTGDSSPPAIRGDWVLYAAGPLRKMPSAVGSG